MHMVQLLCKSGAQLEAKDRGQHTPLHSPHSPRYGRPEATTEPAIGKGAALGFWQTYLLARIALRVASFLPGVLLSSITNCRQSKIR